MARGSEQRLQIDPSELARRIFTIGAMKGPIVDKDAAFKAAADLTDEYRIRGVSGKDARRIIGTHMDTLHGGTAREQSTAAASLMRTREALRNAK